MSHHAVDLLKKYAEIINEAQQPERLDEGLLDTLKGLAQKVPGLGDVTTKLQALPGFEQAYTKAQGLSAQIQQIAKSSTSAKDAIQKVKQLISGQAQQQVPAGQVAEGFMGAAAVSTALLALYNAANAAFNLGPGALLVVLMAIAAVMFIGTAAGSDADGPAGSYK
jgi:hypothetical protein